MIKEPLEATDQSLPGRSLESDDNDAVMPRMLPSERVEEVAIRAENHGMLFECQSHDFGIRCSFDTENPKVKYHMPQHFEDRPGRFRKILVKKKVHATASYAETCRSAISEANWRADEICSEVMP